MTTFSPDAAAALDGPAWLRAAAPPRPSASPPAPCRRPRRRSGATAASPSSTSTPSRPPTAGTDRRHRRRCRPASRCDRRRADADLAGSVMDEPTDVFAELNAALRRRRSCVRGRRRAPCVAEPIVVEHRAGRRRAPTFPRLVVEARRGRRGRRSSSASPPTTSRALVVPVTELHAGAGARAALPRRQRARAAGLADRLTRSRRAERDSHTLLATVALGGDYARVRTDARLDRPGRHRATRSPSTSARATRCTTSAPCRTTPRPKTTLEPAVQGRRRRATPAACTPASSGCGRRPGAPTPSRPTAT